MNDYIYGMEAEQYSFIRIPKVLLEHPYYQGLSAEAKLLYSVLLDRMSMSVKNGWKDSLNRVYIIFTIEEIMRSMNCGNKKAVQLLGELEDKVGLIERKRQGLGKPNLIYVKNFIRLVDNFGGRHFLKCQNDISGGVETTLQEMSNAHSINTDMNKTECIKTDRINILPSFRENGHTETMPEEAKRNEAKGSDEADPSDRLDEKQYREYFGEKLDMELLMERYPLERETLTALLELLVETCASGKETIRVAGDKRPAQEVRNRLMQLTSEHIAYVMNCLNRNTTKVRDTKAYMLTTLYNAPVSMDMYYQLLVNHDMYGSQEGG